MRYEILDEKAEVQGVIIADADFVEKEYPGRHVLSSAPNAEAAMGNTDICDIPAKPDLDWVAVSDRLSTIEGKLDLLLATKQEAVQ